MTAREPWFAAPLPESPEVLRQVLRDAVQYAREGRESHVRWAEHLEAHAGGACEGCTPDVVATAGDEEERRHRVRNARHALRYRASRSQKEPS